MILEISGELSEQIESAARIRGTDAANFVIEAARRAVEEASPPSASEARRQAAAAGLECSQGAEAAWTNSWPSGTPKARPNMRNGKTAVQSSVTNYETGGAASVPLGGTYVLDSSAMLAYLKNEVGGALVAGMLGDVTATIYAHSVNLVEVRYDFGAPSVASNAAAASRALAQLFAAGVQERRDNDAAFFEDIATLIAERRAQPVPPNNSNAKPRLALGDAFGLALARRLNVEFVTADQTEIVPMQTTGFCRALFIR